MIRNGLIYRYTLDYGDPVHIYGPAAALTVDGVIYMPDPDRYCVRPMIEVFDQDDKHLFDASPQRVSQPLSEAELDDWVKGGWVWGIA